MKPEYAILSEHKRDGITTVRIDTKKATYQGIKWSELGDFGKRKLENLIKLTRAPERIRVSYA